MRISGPRLAVGAAVLAASLASVTGVHGFSRIDDVGGSSDAKDGIIVVPLPPIDGGSARDRFPTPPPDGSGNGRAPEPEGTDSGEVPISPADEAREKARRDLERQRTAPDQPRQPAPISIDPSSGKGSRPGSSSEKGSAATPAKQNRFFEGESDLPPAVRNLRASLMEAARTGDIEKLRPFIKPGDDGTLLTFGDPGDDPIAFLKDSSDDGRGLDTLAILLKILKSAHVHVNAGSPDEMYVWPYFTQLPIDKLTKPQLVELFELVSVGDYDEMKEFGAYNFFRVGISPQGKLEFFVAGD